MVSQKSETTIIIILCVLKHLIYDHPHTVSHSPRWVGCMYDYMYLGRNGDSLTNCWKVNVYCVGCGQEICTIRMWA